MESETESPGALSPQRPSMFSDGEDTPSGSRSRRTSVSTNVGPGRKVMDWDYAMKELANIQGKAYVLTFPQSSPLLSFLLCSCRSLLSPSLLALWPASLFLYLHNANRSFPYSVIDRSATLKSAFQPARRRALSSTPAAIVGALEKLAKEEEEREKSGKKAEESEGEKEDKAPEIPMTKEEKMQMMGALQLGFISAFAFSCSTACLIDCCPSAFFCSVPYAYLPFRYCVCCLA